MRAGFSEVFAGLQARFGFAAKSFAWDRVSRGWSLVRNARRSDWGAVQGGLAIRLEAHSSGIISLVKDLDMLRFLVIVFGFAAAMTAPVLVLAQTQQSHPDAASLAEMIDINALIDVMRAEGRDNAVGVDKDLLDGQGGAAWKLAVDRVYEPGKLRAVFDASLTRELKDAPEVRSAMADFFGSDLGKRIVGLEIAARRTLLDDSAEDAAKTVWNKAFEANSPRAKQIEHFAKINDLIESNVMGALNSNLAFFKGLSAGGAFEEAMPEDEMVAQVWAQEGDIRADTADWLYPFLMLAYQPLSDAEFEKYIAFSETPAGKKINAAIFAAFDDMFVQLSTELGTSAAMLMAGEDI
jgi:hypothetical protein